MTVLMRVPASHSLHLLLALTNYFQPNSQNIITELVLYPGNHTLCSMLVMANVNQLWLYSNTSHFSDMNIVCIDRTARFEFTNITRIHISDVNFLGCGGNVIGGAVVVSESTATFLNCNFEGNHAGIGGAIL